MLLKQPMQQQLAKSESRHEGLSTPYRRSMAARADDLPQLM